MNTYRNSYHGGIKLHARFLELKADFSRLELADRSRFLMQVREVIKDNVRGFSNNYSRRNRFNTFIPSSWVIESQQLAKITEAIKNYMGDKTYSAAEDLLNVINESSSSVRNRFSWIDTFENLDIGEIRHCRDCGVIEWQDEATFVYDDDYVCRNCVDDYYWHESTDMYVRHDDSDYSEDDDSEDRDALIGGYHSCKELEKVGHIPSSFDFHKKPIYLGLELEISINEDTSRHDRAQQLMDAIGYIKGERYIALEDDSSIGRGFEMITGYTGLDVHKKQLQFFEQNKLRGATSHDSENCGLHVHICKSDMSVLHAAKMVFFINDSNNENLVFALARRRASNYAKIKDKKGEKDWLKHAHSRRNRPDALQSINSDRYEALNFHNPNTIEFRLFKGSLRYQTIMACLEFTYATWFFTRDASIEELKTQNFIEFISRPENRNTTKFLREYLAAKGFNIPALALVRKNPRIDSSEHMLAAA